MFVFSLLGYFFGIRALQENRELKEEIAYDRFLEDWRRNACTKGQHFVGINEITPTRVWCEICGVHVKLTDPEDSTKGWIWPKKLA